MRPHVLYVTPILGYPAFGGPRLRTYNTLRALARCADVSLFLTDQPDTPDRAAARAHLLSFCRDVVFPDPDPASSPSGVRSVLRAIVPSPVRSVVRRLRTPVHVDGDAPVERDPAVIERLREWILGARPDLIWLGFGGISYDLVPLKAQTGTPLVLETECVWSRFILRELPFVAASRRERVLREGQAKEAEERAGAPLVDLTTAASEVDADYFRSLVEDPGRVMLLANVIDVDAYQAPPSQAHLQQPIEVRLHQPTEAHLQPPSAVRVQQPTEAHLQQPTEVRLQQRTEVRVQQPTEAHLQQPTEARLQQRTEVRLQQRTEACVQQPALVFAGSLSRGTANVDATCWLVDEVLPLVWRRRPDVHVYVVGRSPAPEIVARRGPRVHVTGEVPSIVPYLRASAAALVPLRWESGTRFKILEAFACKTPVVSTTLGAEGLAVENGRHLLLADDPAAFSSAILSLLEAPALGQALVEPAYDLVRAEYDLPAAERQINAILARLAVVHEAVRP